jgi:hypothetical protein
MKQPGDATKPQKELAQHYPKKLRIRPGDLNETRCNNQAMQRSRRKSWRSTIQKN